MTATKYQSVYKEKPRNGKGNSYYVSVYLGHDPLTGKRIIKKTRHDQYGNHFKTARDAYYEAERLKEEYRRNGLPVNNGQATMCESSMFIMAALVASRYFINWSVKRLVNSCADSLCLKK